MEVKGTWVNSKDIREVKAKSKQTEIYLSYQLINKHNAKWSKRNVPHEELYDNTILFYIMLFS